MIRNLAIGAGAGAVLSLGHAPFDLPYLAVLALPLIIWLHSQTQSHKSAALLGLIIGSAYFALSLRWILEPFAVEAEVFGWMAPFALILLAVGLSLFWGAAFALARTPLALVVAWPLAEWLREILFTGFPWGKPSYILIDTPFAQLAALIGPTGLFCAMVALAALPFVHRLWGSAAAATIILLCAIWGIARIPKTPELQTDKTIRIVQPNAPQTEKWDPDFMPIFFERSVRLSNADGNPDLILWPETSIPFWYNANDPNLPQAAALPGPELLAGVREYTDDLLYNTVLHVQSGQVQDTYRKHHLVPFGEYVPFANILGFSGLAAEAGFGFSSGSGPKLLQTTLGAVLPLICYEAIFPRDLRTQARPDWIAHLTNDAWFGLTLGPQQHLAQTRFRAIEQGLPIARAANTGISAMIDPYGRVLDHIPLGQTGAIDAPLPTPLPATFYSRWTEFPWLAFVAFLTLFLIRQKRRDNSH